MVRRRGRWCCAHSDDFDSVMCGRIPFEYGINALLHEWGQFEVQEILGAYFLNRVQQQVKAVWIGLSGDPRKANLRMFVTLNPYIPLENRDDLYWSQQPDMPLDISFNNCDVLVDGIKYYFVLTAGEIAFKLDQCLPPNAILRQNQYDEPIFNRNVWGGIGIIEFLADVEEAQVRIHCQNLMKFYGERYFSKDWVIARLCDRWGKTVIKQHTHILQDSYLQNLHSL